MRLLPVVTGACMLCLLAACTGSLFQTKATPPTMYLLSAGASADAVPDAVPAPELAVDLAVLKPRVRAGLDTDRIAALYPDRRLDYFANARWTGPLDEVVQDLTVQMFHSRAGLRNVSGDVSAFASAFWLELEVTDFQAEYAADGGPPTVHIHLLARIGSSAERRIIARFETDARHAAADNRLGAIVDAYNLAANVALQELAADCAGALGKASESR